MSVCYANQGTGNWTISSAPTINGLPTTTVYPGGGGCLVSNGTSLDWQPGRVGDEARLNVANTFNKGQAVAPFALTDGATIAVDASQSNIFTVTLGGNRTLANPTNLVAGQTLIFYFTQDATGSRTLAYGTDFKFPGGVAPTLTTAANATDALSCNAKTTTFLACQAVLNFQ